MSNTDIGQSVPQPKKPRVVDHNYASTSQVKVEASKQRLEEEFSGEERMKRHRMEIAGRVWVPDIWGQESQLTDWVDCAAFDSSLVPNGVVLARKALLEECRRANTGGIRIENRV